MNQAKIAEELGISQPFLSQILNGSRGVSKKMAQKLADRLGGNPSDWIFATPADIKLALDGREKDKN